MPVIIARVLYPIPFRTRKSSLSAPMVLCLKTWKSRTLPGFKKYENSKFFKIPEKKRPKFKNGKKTWSCLHNK